MKKQFGVGVGSLGREAGTTGEGRGSPQVSTLFNGEEISATHFPSETVHLFPHLKLFTYPRLWVSRELIWEVGVQMNPREKACMRGLRHRCV